MHSNRATAVTVVETTRSQEICAGCGLCAAVCPEQAITMYWSKSLVWVPRIDMAKCTDCGLCVKVCPNTPECISEYALAAAEAGERFGLDKDAHCFIAYDLNTENRIRSASGGALTAILIHILKAGEIDGVIASVPVMAPMGEPHYEVRVMRSIEELDQARSSHYHPLCYDKAVSEIGQDGGRYALVGVPCVIRGTRRLPEKIASRIRYTFALVCSHNVTGQFVDCLARQEGVLEGEPYTANLRDKFGGIPNANSFNNCFRLSNREIRRNRFQTAFTDMWRNYFFAPECCLYCPDFYGADADMSIKDAWGRLSKDPRGMTLLIVRNPELVTKLQKLKTQESLYLESCDTEEVFKSQVTTPRFKHVEVRDRLVWKAAIRRELRTNNYSLGTARRWQSRNSQEHWRLRIMITSSKFFYSHWRRVPVRSMILMSHPLVLPREMLRRLFSLTRPLLLSLSLAARFWGLRHPVRPATSNGLRVLIAGGYGYENIGDEAQLAANLKHWRNAVPDCRITVITPNRLYTERVHGVHTELAPRIVFFHANIKPHYGTSSRQFKLRFLLLAPLLLFNARLIRAGLPIFGITAQQARLLDILYASDVLFLSGGGYLTGMTLSRLWDNMLLIRLANAIGVPAILSGQTIGVFGDRLSHLLAGWGLKKAELVYIRDKAESEKALQSINVSGNTVESTFDDALFYEAAPAEEVFQFLATTGIDASRPYIAVNVHYWRQSRDVSQVIIKQLAFALDSISAELNVQIAFVSMHPTDEVALKDVISSMRSASVLVDHNSNIEIAVGVVRNASLCLTMKHHPIIFAMGGGVPTVAIVLDEYYLHKNKGALRIFGQDEFIVLCEPNDICKAAIDKVTEAWDRREEISTQIETRLEELKPRAGEVIYRWLESRKACK